MMPHGEARCTNALLAMRDAADADAGGELF